MNNSGWVWGGGGAGVNNAFKTFLCMTQITVVRNTEKVIQGVVRAPIRASSA